MNANYGYTDGLGEFYLVVDTDKCDGCGDCAEACSKDILEIIFDDYDEKVMKVKDEPMHQIHYICGGCSLPKSETKYICESVCPTKAIKHSW